MTPNESSISSSRELVNFIEQAFKSGCETFYAHTPIAGDVDNERQVRLSRIIIGLASGLATSAGRARLVRMLSRNKPCASCNFRRTATFEIRNNTAGKGFTDELGSCGRELEAVQRQS
jgi:hypothetical protein